MDKIRIERYTGYGVFLYILVFILYGFVARIIPLFMFVNEPVNSYIFIFFAGSGCLLVLLDLIKGRYLFKGKYCWILYAFIGIMAISSLINLQYGYVDNLKTIIWTGIQIAVFYSAYTRVPKDTMMKYVYMIFHFISWIWTAAVMYSLKQFVTMEAYGVEIYPNDWRRQGFRDNRLFGIFNDPNYAAVTCVYVIFMLLYIMQTTKKIWLKCICVPDCMAHGIYIVLSGSRTAIICILAAVFVYVFLMMKNRWLHKRSGILKRIGLALLAVSALLIAGTITEKMIVNIPTIYAEHIMTNAEGNTNSQNTDTAEGLEEQRAQNVLAIEEQGILERQDIGNGTSSIRSRIWMNYLEGTQGRYIIGASPRNISQYMEDQHPEIYERNKRYETHNGFLSVFVGTGILGLGVVLLFMILTGKKIFLYCFGKNPISKEFMVVFSVLIVILIYTCFFTELFFVNNLTTSVFWMLLGTLMYWIDDGKIV